MAASITSGKGTVTFSNVAFHLGVFRIIILCALLLYASRSTLRLALVNNGSDMIICPRRIAKKVGIKERQLLKRLVLCTILLLINVGPIKKNMESQVLDISTAFTNSWADHGFTSTNSSILFAPESEDADKKVSGQHWRRQFVCYNN